MKRLPITLVAILLVLGFNFVHSGFAIGEIKAISIEQYFTDGINRTGEIVYVNGTIAEIEYKEDPFADERTIASFKLRDGNRTIAIILNISLPSGTLTRGSKVTVKFESGTIVESFTSSRGDIVNGDVEVAVFSEEEKKKLINFSTLEDYISKDLKFGDRTITLEGTVDSFAPGDEVRIDLVAEGGTVNVFLDWRVWKKKKVKDVLKTLKKGDRVQVQGHFMMEGAGSIFIFQGETFVSLTK